MVANASTSERLRDFWNHHRGAIGIALIYYILFWIPATFVQVNVLSDPTGISTQQTFFGLNGLTTGTSGIGVCPINQIVWGSEIQKWLFFGWLLIPRLALYFVVPALLRYLDRYRMPPLIFLLVVVSIVAFSFYVGITWSNASPDEPFFCDGVPQLQVLYFIPNLIHLVIPLWGWRYIEKRLKADSPPVTDTTKGI